MTTRLGGGIPLSERQRAEQALSPSVQLMIGCSLTATPYSISQKRRNIPECVAFHFRVECGDVSPLSHCADESAHSIAKIARLYSRPIFGNSPTSGAT